MKTLQEETDSFCLLSIEANLDFHHFRPPKCQGASWVHLADEAVSLFARKQHLSISLQARHPSSYLGESSRRRNKAALPDASCATITIIKRTRNQDVPLALRRKGTEMSKIRGREGLQRWKLLLRSIISIFPLSVFNVCEISLVWV